MLRFSWQSYIIFILFIKLLAASADTNVLQHVEISADKLRQMKTEEILKYMNESIDACENFVEFSSGNYGKYYEEYVTNYTTWNPVYDTIQMMQSRITKELSTTNVGDTATDRKVKNFYKSCLNRATMPDSYSDKLKKLVRAFGQMPILEGDSWRESDFDWAHLVADINSKTDIGIIVYAKIAPGFTDNSINRATLLQPDFILHKKNFYLDKAFRNLRSNVETVIAYNLMNYLNVDDEELAQQTATEILDFEIDLARGMQDLDITKPNILYNVTTIDEVQEIYLPAWDTKKLFATTLDLYPSLVTTQPAYLQNAFEVIQKTPKKIVANYIFYTYLNQYMQYLPQAVSCFDVARVYFNEYLENMIDSKYSRRQEKSYVSFLWEELKLAFEDVLSSNKLYWMHEDTRQLAIDKLNAMKFKISTYEDINFDKKYAKLLLSDHDIIDNIHAIFMQRGHEGKAKITKPPMFRVLPANIPVYVPEENTVYLPVAILQAKTIWSPSYPNAINFGSIGFFIAHEMAHAFDDVGRNYDEGGNFKNWWDEESEKLFEERTACISEQYGNYTFRGMYLPDLEIQAENIADITGIRLAYKAYMRWYTKAPITKRQNESLQGMNYNHKQLFFISFSQALAGGKSEKFTYSNDIHIPEELRIAGALSNLGEFAKAFRCPLESPMNPVKKCEMY